MRSYRSEGSGLVAMEGSIPEPGPGQVLVSVKASSLNYRDVVLARSGVTLDGVGPVPLSDAAGTIAAVGPGVEHLDDGDAVINLFVPGWMSGPVPPAGGEQYGLTVDGWLTDYRIVRQHDLLAMPGHLGFEEAATLPCAALTAFSALDRVGPGDAVLVQGTGGVALFALQFAKAAGATVVVTTSTDAKADRLRSLGADGVVLHTEDPHWGSAVLDLTGGRGVDRVVATVGPASFMESIHALAPGGEIAMIGNLGPDATLDPALLFPKRVTVRPILVGNRIQMEQMLRVVERQRLRPVVDRIFPFEQTQEALSYLGRGAHLGKVVLSNAGR